MPLIATTGRFALGQVFVTAGVRDRLSHFAVIEAIARHVRGDWGDLDEHDWKANDDALEYGSRLFSVYREGDVRYYVITEHDRSVTTVLLPEEY